MVVRPDGSLLACDAEALRLLALVRDEPAPASVLELLAPSRRDAARRALDRVVAGRPLGPIHVALPGADMVPGRLELAIVLVPSGEAGRGSGAVTITARDVTAARRRAREHAMLRAELARARQTAVLGRLVESVAHDLGNVLTAIHGYATIVAEELAGQALDDQLELIRASERGVELTRSLVTRAHLRTGGHLDVAVDDAVGSCARMLRRLLPSRVELVLRLTSDALVAMDPMELDQVLMNLVLNARDAIAGTGRITVETARIEAPRDASDARGVHPAGVLLTVADTGHGMDAETRRHIFEPYFTTKTDGTGAGIGLATVREIVGRAGGSIEVETAPGAGTRFSVRLVAIR